MKTLAGIINARAKMILELVAREIEIAGFSKKLMGGMVLTGGGAQLKYIKDLASYISAISTRIGIPNEYLETPNEIEHPMYATGVGLVLYGLKESENNKTTEEKEEKEEFVSFDKIDDHSEAGSDDIKKPFGIKGVGESVSKWLTKFFKDDNI